MVRPGTKESFFSYVKESCLAMMDGSHVAYGSHLGSNQQAANDDLANIPFDFDTLLASDHTVNGSLGPYGPCIHDDSCLHFRQPYKNNDKLPSNLCQTPPPAPSTDLGLSLDQPSKANLGRRKSQMDIPSILDHSQNYSWEHVLGEDVLPASNYQDGGFDYCNDDDCVSVACSSACEGSCPSQCGEVGITVCCDDDACGTPQLCADEDCEEATHPCTDANCAAEPAVDQQQARGLLITDHDKAAAAALASFGENGAHLGPNGLMHQLPSTSAGSHEGTLSHMNFLDTMPCGSLSMDSMLANMSGQPSFPNQTFQLAFEYALASHIMQYHDPSQGLAHNGSCVANDPAQLISKCTLPKYNPNDLANTDPFLPQLETHECGFQVQDPSDFAQHIFEEHKSTLMMHAHHLGMPGSSHSHVHPHGASPHQPQQQQQQRGYPQQPFYNYGRASHAKNFSPALSPLTNLSMGPSLSATPVSLPTPSPLESDSYMSEAGLAATPFKSSHEAEPESIAEEDGFVCRWLTGNGNAICGQRFENDEQLQKHCKNDHLKQLKKVNGGFRCGWAKCTRDTCFTQRSKVERHMQVHTGFKPVQCKICGAALSAKQALDQHMRIHTGETPWVCTYPGCGCAFKQQSALTMHERTHTGAKPLECEICGKRFSESSNLSKHRRTHNVKGMHECQLCGKDFHRLDQLRRHMGTNHKDRGAEVDALLSEAKSKVRAHKVAKLKKAKSDATGGKGKEAAILDLDDEAALDMIEDSIDAVVI